SRVVGVRRQRRRVRGHAREGDRPREPETAGERGDRAQHQARRRARAAAPPAASRMPVGPGAPGTRAIAPAPPTAARRTATTTVVPPPPSPRASAYPNAIVTTASGERTPRAPPGAGRRAP